MKQTDFNQQAQSQHENRIHEIRKTRNDLHETSSFDWKQPCAREINFLVQNKSKGPPGIGPSPGGIYCPRRGHPPEALNPPPEPRPEFYPERVDEEIIKKEINYHIKTNFLTQLNFTIMKKHLFFLIVAIFAVTTAFGQYKNPDPKVWVGPTCGSDAYHPAAGVPQTYEVSITNIAGYNGDGTFSWKVTKDVNLLTGAAAPGTEYTATAGGATDENIVITWAPASIGQTYYVVVNYTEPNGTCDINNVKVFPVQPRNAFWLDINASIDATVTGIPATAPSVFNVCAPDVTRAEIVTPGDITTARVTYEFGQTTLYAIIHADGYTGDFAGKLKISGLQDNQVVASVTTAGATWTAGTVDAQGNGDYNATLASVSGGVDIPVTIVITNNQHESLTDQPVTISIDGSYTTGGTTYNDLYDGATNCIDQPADADYVIETVKARPTVAPVNPATPGFVTPNPVLR